MKYCTGRSPDLLSRCGLPIRSNPKFEINSGDVDSNSLKRLQLRGQLRIYTEFPFNPDQLDTLDLKPNTVQR